MATSPGSAPNPEVELAVALQREHIWILLACLVISAFINVRKSRCSLPVLLRLLTCSRSSRFPRLSAAVKLECSTDVERGWRCTGRIASP